MNTGFAERETGIFAQKASYGQLVYVLPAVGCADRVLATIEQKIATSALAGRLAGAWSCVVGRVGEIALLLLYDDTATLMRDREHILRGEHALIDPATIEDLSIDAQSVFVGGSGSPETRLIEIRRYRLKPGQLVTMLDAWAKVVDARRELSELTAVMYGRSGPSPLLTQVWPYRSLEHRLSVRSASVAQKIWPPPGGLATIAAMRSDLYVPTRFCP